MFAERDLNPEELAYLELLGEHFRTTEDERTHVETQYARRLMTRGLPVLFDDGHLAWTTCTPVYVLRSFAMRPTDHYSRFRIPKRSGGSRELAAPGPALKHVQRWIDRTILNSLVAHENAHGFVRGRSIVTNASPHVNQPMVMKLDLVDFFSSIEARKVFDLFRRIGYSVSVSELLMKLCTLDGSLPQGAPTSPGIANAIASKLDRRLSGIAKKHGLAYTRYADDLTFSGAAIGGSHINRLIDRVIRDSGFRPNEHKTRFLRTSNRQAVTGVVVNEHVNWPRDKRRKLRQELHYLQKFGAESHLGRIGAADRRNFRAHYYGRVMALNAVRPDEASEMLKVLDRVVWE